MPTDNITKTVKIYTLSDPRSGEIRYVGKTTNHLKYRLSAHLSEATYADTTTHKIRWIRLLISQGALPEITLIEECSPENWKEREIFWVAEGKRRGWNLTNITEGGDGCLGAKPSAETREKLSKARIGNKNRLGIKHTEEDKKKIGAASKGRIFSEDHKKKIGAAQQGSLSNSAKLTEDDIRDIRRRIAAGETQRSLAIEYGVGFPTINKIHLRQRWKHVED